MLGESISRLLDRTPALTSRPGKHWSVCTWYSFDTGALVNCRSYRSSGRVSKETLLIYGDGALKNNKTAQIAGLKLAYDQMTHYVQIIEKARFLYPFIA